MHFKKYVLVLCLFLFGMGLSFGQSGNDEEVDTLSIDSLELEYITLDNPFKHKSNTWVNVPNGYTALDSIASYNVSGFYGISLNPKAELVSIMVPNPNKINTEEPYIIVLYYEGLVPDKSELDGIDKDNIFEALQTRKNSKNGINWHFNDWIPEDSKFDKKRNLLKMNAFYTYAGEFHYPQRQIAYWQFGNKGTYHYIWVCPEDKISLFQPPRTELDNLLGVLPSFNFNKPDVNFPYSEDLTIEDIVCMEDLGPSKGINNNESESSENTNTEAPEETYEEPEPTPVFGLPALIMILGQLSWYQLGGIIGVPIIMTLVIFLFNSGAGKRKKKEVPWD